MKTYVKKQMSKESADVDSRARLNVLSICTGAGGLELGLRLAMPEARAICYLEREAFACSVLAKRMQDKVMDAAPVWSDLTTFDGLPWRGVVDCVVGGYPCQGFSAMGKRKGRDDPRYLWPQVARIITETSPSLVFFENVANHLNIGFDEVLEDLQGLGFGVQAGLFEASEVGTSHHRKRLFILGYSESWRRRWNREFEDLRHEVEVGGPGGALVVDHGGIAWHGGLPMFPPGPDAKRQWVSIYEADPSCYPCEVPLRNQAGVEPAVPRVVDELAKGLVKPRDVNRLDRLRLMGNGVVPSCAAYAFGVLASKSCGEPIR